MAALSEKLVLYMSLAKTLLILQLCLLLQAVCAGQNIDTNLDEFVSALTALKNEAIKENLSDFELLVEKKSATASRTESWGPILRLWATGQRDFIELLWWHKDDRETRAFIVALYWCSHPPPSENAPGWPASVADFSGHAGRFASPEKELRVDETRFVRKHLSAIAKELADVLEKSKSSNATQLAKRYRDVAKKSEGEPLPKLAPATNPK